MRGVSTVSSYPFRKGRYPFKIKYIDEGIEEIFYFLYSIELYQLEQIYEAFLRTGHYRELYRDIDGRIVSQDPDNCLWDADEMIYRILSYTSIISTNGLFHKIIQEVEKLGIHTRESERMVSKLREWNLF